MRYVYCYVLPTTFSDSRTSLIFLVSVRVRWTRHKSKSFVIDSYTKVSGSDLCYVPISKWSISLSVFILCDWLTVWLIDQTKKWDINWLRHCLMNIDLIDHQTWQHILIDNQTINDRSISHSVEQWTLILQIADILEHYVWSGQTIWSNSWHLRSYQSLFRLLSIISNKQSQTIHVCED